MNSEEDKKKYEKNMEEEMGCINDNLFEKKTYMSRSLRKADRVLLQLFMNKSGINSFH
jgi:hypothetical protein